MASNLTMSGIRFFSTGGSLMNLTSPAWPGTRDGDLAALQVVAVEEGRQRLADQLLGVGVGLAEDLGVLDEVERLGHDLVGRLARDELQRLEGGLADVERPDGLDLRHARVLLSGKWGRDPDPGLFAVNRRLDVGGDEQPGRESRPVIEPSRYSSENNSQETGRRDGIPARGWRDQSRGEFIRLMQDSIHPIGLERIAPATSQSLMPGTYEKFRRRVRFRRRSRQHPRKRNGRRADHPTLSRNLNIRIPSFTGSARQKRCSRSSQSANVNRPPPRGPGQSAADE